MTDTPSLAKKPTLERRTYQQPHGWTAHLETDGHLVAWIDVLPDAPGPTPDPLTLDYAEQALSRHGFNRCDG